MSNEGLDGAECDRLCDADAAEDVARADTTSGAIVSRLPSSKAVSPKTVAFGSASSIAFPQFQQNRAVSGFLFPQAIQNMCAGFYH